MNGFDKLVIECEKNINLYTTHLDYLRRQIEAIEKAKRIVKNTDSNSDLTPFLELENLNNYSGYLTVSTLDLSVNLKNLINAKTDWERIFFIKNAYLTIHETLKNLKPSPNKDFLKDSIKNNYPSLSSDYEELMKDIADYKNNEEYKRIELTRHHTAGHIIENLKIYYDRVKELNGEVAGRKIAEFLIISRKTLNLINSYTLMANERSLKENQELKDKIAAKTKAIFKKQL